GNVVVNPVGSLTLALGALLTSGSGSAAVTVGAGPNASLNLVGETVLFQNNGGSGNTVLNSVTRTGNLLVAAASNVVLPGVNSCGGGTAPSAGTRTVGNHAALGTGMLTLTAGTLQASSAVTLANPLAFNNSVVTIGGSSNLTLAGPGTLADVSAPANTLD